MTPQDLEGQPKIITSGVVVEPQSNGFTAAGDGFLKLAERTMDFGQRGMVNRHAGLQGDRLADQPRGQTSLALMMAQNPQQVKGIGMRSVFV